jgi:hypothetical protein
MKPQFQLPILSGRDEKLGEYFVDVEVGTPGQSFWVIADTGSELTWFNSMKKVHKSNHGGHKHKRSKTKRRARTRTRTKSRTGTSKRKRRVGSNNPCHGVFCPHNSNTFQQVSCSSKVCKEDLSAVFSLAYCPNPSDPCLYDIRFVNFFPFFFIYLFIVGFWNFFFLILMFSGVFAKFNFYLFYCCK